MKKANLFPSIILCFIMLAEINATETPGLNSCQIRYPDTSNPFHAQKDVFQMAIGKSELCMFPDNQTLLEKEPNLSLTNGNTNSEDLKSLFSPISSSYPYPQIEYKSVSGNQAGTSFLWAVVSCTAVFGVGGWAIDKVSGSNTANFGTWCAIGAGIGVIAWLFTEK